MKPPYDFGPLERVAADNKSELLDTWNCVKRFLPEGTLLSKRHNHGRYQWKALVLPSGDYLAVGCLRDETLDFARHSVRLRQLTVQKPGEKEGPASLDVEASFEVIEYEVMLRHYGDPSYSEAIAEVIYERITDIVFEFAR